MAYMRPQYGDTALPAANATVTLYNSNVANDGVPKTMFSQGCITRYSLDLKNDQAGTLTIEKSKDGGTNWVVVKSLAVAATASTDVFHLEWPIAAYQDLRVKFANGGTVQGVFVVDQSLDDRPINPGATGLAGAGSPQAAADALANPTEDGVLSYLFGYNGTTWDRIRASTLAISATFTGLLQVLGRAMYNLTPATRTDGQHGPLEADATGNLRIAEQFQPASEDNTNGVIAVSIKPLAAATYAPSTFSNIGAATTANVKASAGNLFSVSALNANVAAIRYLQLFNSTASTATVVFEFTMPPNSTIEVGTDFFTTQGFQFSVGITWGVSTTKGTYAAATAAEHTVQGSYQ